MNGTRARAIRKQVGYWIKEPKSSGIYKAIKRIFKTYPKDSDGKPVLDRAGKPLEIDKVTLQIICTGKRVAYKKAKKEYEQERRNRGGSV